MRIQERCYVGRVMAGLWLLGWVALASGVDHQHPLGSTTVGTTTTISYTTPDESANSSSSSTTDFVLPVDDEQNDVPSVVPLDEETTIFAPEVTTENSIINSTETTIDTTKSEYPTKTSDPKTSNDGKKKLVNEFKTKSETKYQKVKDDDKSKDWTITTDSMASSSTESSVVKKMLEIENSTDGRNAIPLLFRGEPVGWEEVNATASNETEDSRESTTVGGRARALNISAAEPTNSLHANLTDLSDVSMDDEDKEVEGDEYEVNRNETTTILSSTTMLPDQTTSCMDGNRTFAIGEKIVRGCEEQCVCSAEGKITDCEPLCHSPALRAGRNGNDPSCHEKSVGDDGCCAILVCTDSVTEPNETCTVGNKTLTKGQRFEDGCSKICVCEAEGTLKCQPRCPPNETASGINQHDRCVALTDPRDSCCTITLCDVTLGDHEIKAENSGDLSVNLTNVKVLNSTAIKLKMSSALPGDVVVEISEDNHVWRQQKPDKNGILTNLEPAHTYFVRVTEGGRTGPALQVFLPAEVIKTNVPEKMDKNSCSHRGKLYKIGAEWYDECISFCVCGEGPKTECVTIECPTDFGLDVLDPHCLDWETVPADFVPKAPQCCPQEVRCRNNGSCSYEGSRYDNWSELPTNVTGCEKRCYCEMGNVTCQAACPPVTALPPANLQCPSNLAVLAHLPGDDCCSHWVCDRSDVQTTTGMNNYNVPTGFPVHGGIPGFHKNNQGLQGSQEEVTVKALEALDEETIRIIFMVPSILVGLQARVELRYTSDMSNPDPSTWKSQVFIPPNDLIATPQLEFELDGLEPATDYKVKVTVMLRGLDNNPSSKIYSVRTLDRHEEVPTLPPQIPMDAELKLVETNSTWISVAWKKFTEYEMQFIDGVQLRYKEHDGKVYAATPLIHRAVTNYVIENLKPSTNYEIGISIIPFPGQTTELISEKTIQVVTAVEPDPYSFDVKVEIKTIKSSGVEVSWSGVPYPEDKYVNIYRAIYQSDSGKEDTSTFKIAKRDSPAKTLISDLKPGTRYRLWIEVYLTNGRIKKSNVQDFVTKPGKVLAAGVSQQDKLASIPLHEGDYYGPLVIVAIVASLAILSTLILLMMLMKRRSSSKADISPRKTTAAYDNPSYKTCEDAAPVANGRNKNGDHEMTTINLNADAKETP